MNSVLAFHGARVKKVANLGSRDPCHRTVADADDTYLFVVVCTVSRGTLKTVKPGWLYRYESV